MKITDFFDKTFCINLDRRFDRWEECLIEFKKYGIEDVVRWSAIDGNNINKLGSCEKSSQTALILTNIDIIEDSIKNNLKNVLIMEDDIKFNDEVYNISEYFKYLPEDWDMVYFGGNHNSHMGVNPPLIINEKVCKLHYTFTTHCVGINGKSFNTIINKLKEFNNPLDVIYTDLQRSLNVYCFYPLIATQRISYSDIENKVVNYSWLIK
jgi:hypothetical protein